MTARLAAVCFAWCIAVSAVGDTTLNWTGASDNRWANAANWSPAQVPQSGDDLRFNTATSNLSMLNDLPASTVLRSLNFFVFPAVAFSVSGSAVPVSGSIFGVEQA